MNDYIEPHSLQEIKNINISDVLFQMPTNENNNLTNLKVWDRFTLQSRNQIRCDISNLEKEYNRVEQLHHKNDKALIEYLQIKENLRDFERKNKPLVI